MDLISREEVHRALAFYIYELATDALTVDEFRTKIRECIDTIPPQNKWIPVSEMLPDIDEEVLVDDGLDIFVAWWVDDGFEARWHSNDESYSPNRSILAWQPLPKSYKAESEE